MQLPSLCEMDFSHTSLSEIAKRVKKAKKIP
jgi:hypothetical protein